MRVLIQRVKKASVEIEHSIHGTIQNGYCMFVGFTHTDTEETLLKMAKKCVGLRIFEDENGKTNCDLHSVNGQILSISQFTLYADTSHGNRPSFTGAMQPDQANILYEKWNQILRDYGIHVETGIFGSEMLVSIENDGPFTILLEI